MVVTNRSHYRVERQQDDSLGIHEPAVDGVGRLGHHHGSLARAGRSHHLHAVVEARVGPCLFWGERFALHPVQQFFAGHQFAFHVGGVERGPSRTVVGFPSGQRACDRLGSWSQPDRHARFLQARSEGGWINRGAGSEKVLLLLVGEPAALLEAGPLLFCLVVQPRVYRALHALEERHVLPQALLPQHHVQRLNQGGALGVGQPVGLHFPVPPRMKRDVSPEGAGIDVVSGLVFDLEPWVRPSSAKTSSRPSKRKRQSDEPVTCRPTHDAAHSLAIIQQ